MFFGLFVYGCYQWLKTIPTPFFEIRVYGEIAEAAWSNLVKNLKHTPLIG
jgi:hypothetical protein